MIEGRTVFILGAGASCPYGFPTSMELREHISKSFVNEIGQLTTSDRPRDGPRADLIREAEAFVKIFCHPMQQASVDLFLSRHQEYTRIGKMAILLSILSAERHSRFGTSVHHPDVDWYTYIVGKMTEGLSKKADIKRFPRNQVSFITFNYDRSLEHFLCNSLCACFSGVSPEDIRPMIDAMDITHVYGRLSPLDWQAPSQAGKALAYGSDIHLVDIDSLIRDLKVIGERDPSVEVAADRDTWPQAEELRFALEEAEEMFFLGFGYAEENLKVLGLPDVLKTSQRVYGTALGRTPKEIRHLQDFFDMGLSKRGIRGFADGQVKILNCDCVQLLRDFL